MPVHKSIYRIAEALYTIAQELHHLSEELRPAPHPEEESARIARVRRLPVTDLELSVRLVNALVKNGLETVGDVVDRSEAEIRALQNLGHRSVYELKDTLKAFGLAFRKED